MNDQIERRGILIVSFQLEGICNALKFMVQAGANPGDETRSIVKKLWSDFQDIASGKVVKDLPDVSDITSAADLLAIAETLRTSALCFLTPDEQDERKRSIGFINHE